MFQIQMVSLLSQPISIAWSEQTPNLLFFGHLVCFSLLLHIWSIIINATTPPVSKLNWHFHLGNHPDIGISKRQNENFPSARFPNLSQFLVEFVKVLIISALFWRWGHSEIWTLASTPGGPNNIYRLIILHQVQMKIICIYTEWRKLTILI